MNKLHIIPEKCIACGLCYLHYPEVFDCNDEGIAFIKKESTTRQQDESTPAVYRCPTRAIEIVDHQLN
ncbi:ferredoxin [Fundicoccus sp. Sow4_D5]|uniref:ferredoxin n=1 Tax=unclassified Fundicoccus TaxID=2761543 RepID=UPI003F924809